MNFEVLTIGKSKDAWLENFIEAYEKKINQLVKFKFTNLRGIAISRDSANYKKEVESKKLLESLHDEDVVIFMDEKGKSSATLEFAKNVQRLMQSGKRRLVFVVGGPFGVTEDLKKRADHVYSLSPLTLSHQVAITVLMEQIFRVLCVWRGIPYHNE
ncbi:MAG: 23S rRNA (pseudouridine(1915)-N(3))-methyltransferase RlmH [Pseudomonadota bacterium]|nr:23S rRNA (pseudouridine(1915)-N(3))-methyltransferase RlmH [Pseudomonadota bacterium]